MQSLLKKVELLRDDSKDCGLSARPSFCHESTVCLNSFLFVDDVKVFVLSELCSLSRARFIISRRHTADVIDPHVRVIYVPSGNFTRFHAGRLVGQPSQSAFSLIYETWNKSNNTSPFSRTKVHFNDQIQWITPATRAAMWSLWAPYIESDSTYTQQPPPLACKHPQTAGITLTSSLHVHQQVTYHSTPPVRASLREVCELIWKLMACMNPKFWFCN